MNYLYHTKPADFHNQYKNRSAVVKARLGGMVLYNIMQGDRVVVENYIVPTNVFDKRYG